MLLKSLGADISITNNQGLRPSQFLLDRSEPEKAAKLEGRPMNEEEQRVFTALGHPIASRFEKSAFRHMSWIIRSPPDQGLRGFDDDDDIQDSRPHADKKLSDLLGGCSPKRVVLGLPLTRYSELYEYPAFEATPLATSSAASALRRSPRRTRRCSLPRSGQGHSALT